MELTKQHKALLGVVGVGAVIVSADWLFFRDGAAMGPSAALAQQETSVGDRANAPAVEQLDAVLGMGVADRLATYSERAGFSGSSLDDPRLAALSAPKEWLSAETTTTAVNKAYSIDTSGDVIAGVRLTSVWPDQGAAFVSGVRLEVGKPREVMVGSRGAPSTMKLVRVEGPSGGLRGSAVLEVNGRKHTLVIEAPKSKVNNTAIIPLK